MSTNKTQDYFEQDNFTSRRTTGHNAYDPESLITGAEIEAGLTYHDSRQFDSQQDYDEVVSGRVPVDAVPIIAPRVKTYDAELVSDGPKPTNVCTGLFVGANNHTHKVDTDTLYSVLDAELGGYTVLPAQGRWLGQSEESVLVITALSLPEARTLAHTLARALDQDCVAVTQIGTGLEFIR